MTDQEKTNRLDQRRRYLEKRVAAKAEMGWDNQYDREEMEALTWALRRLKETEGLFKTWT